MPKSNKVNGAKESQAGRLGGEIPVGHAMWRLTAARFARSIRHDKWLAAAAATQASPLLARMAGGLSGRAATGGEASGDPLRKFAGGGGGGRGKATE